MEFYDYDEKLKHEIVMTLMDTKYKNRKDDYDNILKELNSLSSIDLDTMLRNYYLYEIKP